MADKTASIRYVEDKNGDIFFPVTHQRGVVDSDGNNLETALAGKQDTLVSGTSIKTINGSSILGSGNIEVQTEITMDNVPTSGSNNPVKSGGLYTALAAKQNNLTFDNTPIASSNNPVKSGGLYTVLAEKIGSQDIDNVVELTLAQYNALATKDARTMYIVSDSAIPSDHVGVASLVQTTTSTADGGTNVWTCTLTNGQSFTLQVRNGNQGNSGYSGAAGELEVVNNVTQGGATSALSAEMGKQLEGEISQLGLELQEIVYGVIARESYLVPRGYDYTIKRGKSIPLSQGITYIFNFTKSVSSAPLYISLRDDSTSAAIVSGSLTIVAENTSGTIRYTPANDIVVFVGYNHGDWDGINVSVVVTNDSGGLQTTIDEHSASIESLENQIGSLDEEKADYEIVDGMDYVVKHEYHYIKFADGTESGSSNFEYYLLPNIGIKRLSTIVGATDSVPAAIAFYSGNPSASTYLSATSIQMEIGKTSYSAEVPAECKYIIISNRPAQVGTPAITLELFPEAETINDSAKNYEIDGTSPDVCVEIDNTYINNADGEATSSTSNKVYKIHNWGYKKIKAYLAFNDSNSAAIAFYNSETIGSASLISTIVGKKYNAPTNYYLAEVPDNCVTIAITNRKATLVSPSITLYSAISKNMAKTLQSTEVSDFKGIVSYLSARGNSQFLFDGPAYAHLFIEDIEQSASPIIPSQSLSDIAIAARLGYKYIEANVQVTSDNVLIAIHGSGGNFGYEVEDLEGGFTYAGTAINSVTYEWITQNLRYRSSVAKYKTTIPTLAEFLAECKKWGISVMMTYSSASYALAKKFFGDNWIAYQGNRSAGFNGIIMQYSSLTSKVDILEQCDLKGVPYIHMMNNDAFNSFKNAGTLADLAQSVHEKGCLLGLASCYHTTAETLEFLEAGGDVLAASSYTNFPESGNLVNLVADTNFSDFNTTGTESGGNLNLASGDTLASPSADVVSLGKGSLEIKFSGSLTINSFGHSKNSSKTITSDGKQTTILNTFFLNQAPTFALTAAAATTVYALKYKASKC